MRKILNKLTEAFAYRAKMEARSDPIIEETVKNNEELHETVKNNEELPQALDETIALVETKFPPKSHSPNIIVVVIGYVTEVAEEISCPKTVSSSLVGVSNDTILFANEDPNKDNEMEDYFSDFHLEGKVAFNRGGVDRDLDFYFIPEVS